MKVQGNNQHTGSKSDNITGAKTGTSRAYTLTRLKKHDAENGTEQLLLSHREQSPWESWYPGGVYFAQTL